eukprot:scpid51796/ scgid9892/ Long-chain fatty acid transport protein 4; Solute carrier family 27 member 4
MGRLQQIAGLAGVLVAFYLGASVFLLPVAFLAAYAASGGHRFIYLFLKTFPRDFFVLRNLFKIKGKLDEMGKKHMGIQDQFRETAKKYPNKVAVVMEDEQWTYTELEKYANQIGHLFYNLGIKRGNTVALFMENKPEFIASWLGLSRVGVITSFINTNLRLDGLLHCITVCDAKAVIFGLEMKDAIEQIKDRLEAKQVQLYVLGDRGRPAPCPSDINSLNATILDESIAAQPTFPPEDAIPDGNTQISLHDQLFYIYTSGTTGLPKPSKITHQRFFMMGYSLGKYLQLDESTNFYCPLPLYHTNGSVLATSAMLFFGGKLALRRKFSASRFWDDCIKHDCNTMIYIGEICRYLLAQPARDTDTAHAVRLALGNGLKKTMWEKFTKRFGIAKVCEFYGATEANCNMANPMGKVGAVGFNSVIMPSVYPILLVRVNTETNEFIRDRNGLCIRCEPGQPGEIVGKIVDNDPMRRFDGYLDPAATQKKIVHNVLKLGDKFFRSGDILVQDEEGYYYFQDRTGDTFRWKGENVSSQEVEGQMQKLLGMRDVVVYGVEVPGGDGRAGMAAIVGSKDVTDGGVDLVNLHTKVKETMPTYAAPIFLRILPEAAEVTGTFKLKKVALAKEGFDLESVGEDPIYVSVPGKGYQRLEKGETYEKLLKGQLRL